MDTCLKMRINFVEKNYFGERLYEERGNIIRILSEEIGVDSKDIINILNNNSNTVIRNLNSQNFSERDLEMIYEYEKNTKNRAEIIETLEMVLEKRPEKLWVLDNMIDKQLIINLMKKRVCELMEIDSRMPLSKGVRDWYDEGMITGRYTELEVWIERISKM